MEDGMTSSGSIRPRVLTIGMQPSAFDYSRHPGLDEPTIRARSEAANKAVREAGIDAVPCYVSTSPDAAEQALRECLSQDAYQLAMIGAAVRAPLDNAVLLERIVNVLIQAAPGIRLCFNESPESTIDAIRRWIRS
ncbi:hypothetical protein A9W96_14400 [Mycobacterium sp. 1245852.3]|nr:hypothetical protein A9W96_14400 [Mycobacterium sp. 1245852.3]